MLLLLLLLLLLKINKDRQDIKYRINKRGAITAALKDVLWNRQIVVTTKNKLQIYNSIVESTDTYGGETWKFNKNLESKLMSTKMEFMRRSARCSRLEKQKYDKRKKKLVLKIRC